MKTKQLLFSFMAIAIFGTVAIFFLNDVKKENFGEKTYQPRNFSEQKKANYDANGAAEWIRSRRVNPETGTISAQDLALAKKTFENQMLNKSAQAAEMNWQFIGPDNVGGRTRAFLVDKDKSTLWAGGVAGGIWKSTTNGLSWTPISINDMDNITISSICQDNEGNIYVGTGEYFAGLSAINSTSTGFEGGGIWKSTDGVTFSVLSSTENPTQFKYVNELICDPATSYLYAATNIGVLRSTDKGQTWENPFKYEDTNSALTGNATDVKVSTDGTFIISFDNGDASVFVCKNGVNAYKKASQFDTNFNRIELAVAPSDPNYMYALCSYRGNVQNKYFNLYQSTDGGENWHSVITQQTPTVDVFRGNSQGHYDNTISVYPNDPTKVIFGGIDLWTWSENNAFEQISFWMEFAGSKYVHSDQHNIVFHPDFATNNTIYFTNDGGIFGSYNSGYTFTALNTNYGVTQYYAIDCGPKGEILGGTQDNGSPYLDLLQPSNLKSSWEVSGGDGGYSAISELYPGAIFSTTYYSTLQRSNENGAGATMQVNPFDNVGNKSTYSNLRPGNESNPFVTPIAMWESFDYDSSRIYIPFVIDTVVEFSNAGVPDTVFAFGEGYTFLIPSTVVNRKLFEYKITSEDIINNGDSLRPGDTLVVREKFSSLMAIGGRRCLYFTREALNFKDEYPNWDAVVGLTKLGVGAQLVYTNNTIGVETITHLKWAPDGESLYAISSAYGSKIYRFSGFKDAYSYSGPTYDQRVVTKDTIHDLLSTSITSVNLLTSSPINVWSVQYNSGGLKTNNHVVDLDTTFADPKYNLKRNTFFDCDTTSINNVMSSSISSITNSTVNHDLFSFDAGATSYTNIVKLDTTYKNSYLLNLISLNYDNCTNDTIKNFLNDTISSVNPMSFNVSLDSVYTSNLFYNNVYKIDTISLSNPDTIVNIITKTIVGSSCILDTIFNVNNDTIINVSNYTQSIQYSDVTSSTSLVYDSIFKIDTLSTIVNTLVNISYKDYTSGSCNVLYLNGINVDSITNFQTSQQAVTYSEVALTDGITVYDSIVNIEQVSTTYTINLVYQDTTFNMGVPGGDMVWNNRTVNTTNNVVGKMILDLGTKIATSIDVDYNNPDRLIVSVGGYGSHEKVYFTENATDVTPVFQPITGDLPAVPAYSSLISDDAESTIIVGTEYGVYSTKTVNGVSTSWVRETSIPKVPVFNLTQQHLPNGYIEGVCETGIRNSGEIYAGTHGLGAWKMDLYKRPYTGINEISQEKADALFVKVFPNPVKEIANVEYKLNKTSDVEIEVYSLSGKMVYRQSIPNQYKGTHTHKINTENIENGVYVISVTSNNERKVSKFIVE